MSPEIPKTNLDASPADHASIPEPVATPAPVAAAGPVVPEPPTLTPDSPAGGLAGPDSHPHPRESAWGRFATWVLMLGPVAQAREEDARTGPARKVALARARSYADAADWILQSSPEAPGAPALTLYREAIFWLLTPDGSTRETIVAALDAAPRAQLEDAAGGSANLAKLRATLAMRAFLASATLPEKEQVAMAALARRFVHALLASAEAPTLRRVLVRRRWRVGLVLAALTGMLAALVALIVAIIEPSDLARGKPWKTSSTLHALFPNTLMFHTDTEMNPWFEIDLGKPTVVRAVRLKNRTDCCFENARPLLVEVSLDEANWQEVAHLDSVFTVWTVGIKPTTVRFVRLRVPRFTALHLEEVKVF